MYINIGGWGGEAPPPSLLSPLGAFYCTQQRLTTHIGIKFGCSRIVHGQFMRRTLDHYGFPEGNAFIGGISGRTKKNVFS